MNGKDQIIDKILTDAEEKVALDRENATLKADDTIRLAEEKAQKYLDEQNLLAEQMAGSIISKKNSVAQIDGKKLMLGAKQEIISQVFSLCLERLLRLGSEDYLKYVEGKLNAFASSGDKVILSKNAPLSIEQVGSLSVCKKLSLSVEKTGDFKGGIIISTPSCDKDFSFESAVEEMRSNCISQIAERLFNE